MSGPRRRRLHSSAIRAASRFPFTTRCTTPHPPRAGAPRGERRFAAEGYARATGKVGVCCATSGPGATNLVTGLVDAMMDSIPIVAITGQVTSKLIGSDAFQEADTFGITRSCTKHNYLVKNWKTCRRRPRSVLHRRQRPSRAGAGGYHPRTCSRRRATTAGDLDSPARLQGLTEGHTGQIRRAAQMIWEAERPLVYAGGGIIAANASRRTARIGRTDRRARRLHADGPRRAALRTSQLHQHARHARQLRRQHGHDRTAIC
jgi:hypothetical protein